MSYTIIADFFRFHNSYFSPGREKWLFLAEINRKFTARRGIADCLPRKNVL